jgi:ADP-ribose pyrophosphatase
MSKENPWQTLSAKICYENPWIRVIQNDIINPAGNEGIYGVVHFKNNAVAVVPLDDDNNTWLVGQYRYTQNSYEWEVPEGGSPEGEDPADTARRELLEETGLEAATLQLILTMQLSNSVTDEVSYSYIARGLVMKESAPEESEQLQVRKLPFEEAFQMAMNGEIKDALSVATLMKIKLMMLNGTI